MEAPASRPLLTTVTQPIEELAERAVGQLLGRIGQVPEDPETQRAQTIMLMPRLLIRDSCARLVSNASSNVATPR